MSSSDSTLTHIDPDPQPSSLAATILAFLQESVASAPAANDPEVIARLGHIIDKHDGALDLHETFAVELECILEDAMQEPKQDFFLSEVRTLLIMIMELTLKTTPFTDSIKSLAKIHSTLVQLLAAILARSIAKLGRQPTRYLYHLLSELRFLLCEDMVAKILCHGKRLLDATLGDYQSQDEVDVDNDYFIECVSNLLFVIINALQSISAEFLSGSASLPTDRPDQAPSASGSAVEAAVYSTVDTIQNAAVRLFDEFLIPKVMASLNSTFPSYDGYGNDNVMHVDDSSDDMADCKQDAERVAGLFEILVRLFQLPEIAATHCSFVDWWDFEDVGNTSFGTDGDGSIRFRLAKKLVSTGFIRLALNYKNILQLQHQCQPRWQEHHQRALPLPLTLPPVNEQHGNISDRTIFTVFDALIMRLAEILRVFVNCDSEREEKLAPNFGEEMHKSVELGQRRGDAMPVAYAFACLPASLPEILLCLQKDLTAQIASESDEFLCGEIKRAALCVLYMEMALDPFIFRSAESESAIYNKQEEHSKVASASELYSILSDFLTESASLDFLSGCSAVQLLCLYVHAEQHGNGGATFKPHTYRKLVTLVQSTLSSSTYVATWSSPPGGRRAPDAQEVTVDFPVSQTMMRFIAHDALLFPWMWKVCEGSWSLEGFVRNLMVLWLLHRCGSKSYLDAKIHQHTKVEIDADLLTATSIQEIRQYSRMGTIVLENGVGTELFTAIFSDFAKITEPTRSALFDIITGILLVAARDASKSGIKSPIFTLSQAAKARLTGFWEVLVQWILAHRLGVEVVEWWPRINILLVTLGAKETPLAGASFNGLDAVLNRALDDMQQLTQVEQTRIKENSTQTGRTVAKNVNRDEVTLAMNLMQNLTGSLQFLTLLSCASSTLAGHQILSHPLFVASLRQWICRWTLGSDDGDGAGRNIEDQFELLIVAAVLKSAALELLATVVEVGRRMGVDVERISSSMSFLTVCESAMTCIGDVSIIIPALAHFLAASDTLSWSSEETEMRANQILFKIWNVARDLLVSEFDQALTWQELPAIVDCFEALLRRGSKRIARYLVSNSANGFMLETILGALYLRHTDSEQNNDENTNNNAVSLVHVLRLVQLFVAQKPSWLHSFFRTEVMDTFLGLVKDMVTEDVAVTVLNMLKELKLQSLLTNDRQRQVDVMLNNMSDDCAANSEEASRSQPFYDRWLVMCRSFPTYPFMLMSFNHETRDKGNPQKIRTVAKEITSFGKMVMNNTKKEEKKTV